MKRILLFAILATMGFARCAQQPSTQTTQAAEEPKIVVDESKIISLLYDDDRLRAAKAAIEANDPRIMTVYNQFKTFVDRQYLNMKPLSIVEGKRRTAASRDPRDYISHSPYWWPDPEDPTAPYIRHDGFFSPEVYDYPEREVRGPLASSTQALAVMYYLSGDEKYAAKTAELLRHFFLDSTTGMNPNMTFAQHVPGMTRLRGGGINDGQSMFSAINAAKIIEGSESWTEQDEYELKDWTKAFLYWVQNSTNGQAERRQVNNHGTTYEASVMTLLLYVGDYDYLQYRLLNHQLPRFPVVVTEDSISLHEMARNDALSYSVVMLSGMYKTGIIGEKIGINDAWAYTGENGRSIRMYVDHLLPYWHHPETWTGSQRNPYQAARTVPILDHAGRMLNNQHYKDVAADIGINNRSDYNTTRTIEDVLYFDLIK